MKDTPTPRGTVRKAHRRIATVSTDRPGAALPVPGRTRRGTGRLLRRGVLLGGAMALPGGLLATQRALSDLLRQRAGDNNPWLAGEQAATRMISDAWAYRRWRDETQEAMFAVLLA